MRGATGSAARANVATGFAEQQHRRRCAISEVQVPIPGVEYSRLQINIPDTYVGEDGGRYQREYEEVIDDAARVTKLLLGRIGGAQSNGGQPAAQTPQGRAPRAQQQQGGQQGDRNAYPPQGLVSTVNDAVNWMCDKCGNSGEGVARRQQKGRMSGDAIVCLNTACKENDYRYTITFVDTGNDGQRGGDIDPDDLPF